MSEEDFELTPEQKRACDAIGRAMKKAEKMGIEFHNCYCHLIAYPPGTVKSVSDSSDGPACQDIGYECAKLPAEWADDRHFCELTEKGKKLLAKKVEDDE